MALVATSCARCSLSTRARTRLEVDLHGDVDHGSGGSGKMSRHRAESQWSPERAAPSRPMPPAKLSYIPETWSQRLRSTLTHKQRILAA